MITLIRLWWRVGTINVGVPCPEILFHHSRSYVKRKKYVLICVKNWIFMIFGMSASGVSQMGQGFWTQCLFRTRLFRTHRNRKLPVINLLPNKMNWAPLNLGGVTAPIALPRGPNVINPFSSACKPPAAPMAFRSKTRSNKGYFYHQPNLSGDEASPNLQQLSDRHGFRIVECSFFSHTLSSCPNLQKILLTYMSTDDLLS